MNDASDSGLSIRENTLSVTRDLRQDFDLEFDQACNELLEWKGETLVIDLGDVTYINSTYIGMIAATFFQAQAAGKSLRVNACGHVLKILRSAGFEGYIELQDTSPPE